MHILQSQSTQPLMSLSIRDVAIQPDEVPSFVKAYQIETCILLIPATILVYDTRASLLQNMLFPPLTSCQSVRWTKR